MQEVAYITQITKGFLESSKEEMETKCGEQDRDSKRETMHQYCY
jgi:hypothetical protein